MLRYLDSYIQVPSFFTLVRGGTKDGKLSIVSTERTKLSREGSPGRYKDIQTVHGLPFQSKSLYVKERGPTCRVGDSSTPKRRLKEFSGEGGPRSRVSSRIQSLPSFKQTHFSPNIYLSLSYRHTHTPFSTFARCKDPSDRVSPKDSRTSDPCPVGVKVWREESGAGEDYGKGSRTGRRGGRVFEERSTEKTKDNPFLRVGVIGED